MMKIPRKTKKALRKVTLTGGWTRLGVREDRRVSRCGLLKYRIGDYDYEHHIESTRRRIDA